MYPLRQKNDKEELNMKKELWKRVITVVVTCAMMASLAGCGEGSKVSKSASTWDAIKKAGKFTYACSGGYPPFNYKDDAGNLVGFDVEIADALAEKMGIKAEGVTTDWDGIIGGLTGKRFDCIIGSMAITDERKEQINFTDPYYYDGACFFAKKSSGFTSVGDSNVHKVGVVTGTTFAEELAKYDNITDIVNVSTDQENFIACDEGRTDGFVTSRFVGLEAPDNYGFVPVGDWLYTENIGIGIRKDDTEFLEHMNEALSEIIKDGTYEKISVKYFGVNILEQ